MLADAIKSLGGKSFAVSTSTGGITYDAQGRVTDSTPGAPRSVLALVQPLSGRDIQMLPEGVLAKEMRAMYTTGVLNVTGPGSAGDVVVIGNETWTVSFVFDWTDAASFIKYMIAKVDP